MFDSICLGQGDISKCTYGEYIIVIVIGVIIFDVRIGLVEESITEERDDETDWYIATLSGNRCYQKRFLWCEVNALLW